MGSQKTGLWGDLEGVSIFVTASRAYQRTTLYVSWDDECATMDGSGYYSCDITGQYVYLSKPNDASQGSAFFTVCNIEIYQDYNLIDYEMTYGVHLPSITSNAMNGSFDNILVAHPIGYSSLVSEQS